MQKKSNWQHVLGWVGLYIFWIVIFQKRAFTFSQTLTVQFCYLFFMAAIYYFNTYFTIPSLLYRKKHVAFTCCFIGAIFAAAWLRVPLVLYLNKNFFLINKPQPEALQIFYNSFLNIFIWTCAILTVKLVSDRVSFQQYLGKVEKEKLKAELDLLNAQINPHFLFNSINSIFGHIEKSNVTARNMLLTFSDMLRYQLYDCNTERITIEKEMNYIKNYVVLQRARKEDNLVVDLHIDDNLKGFTIAPLLFIAFVENAFKYVSNIDEQENSIIISFKKNDHTLLFKCYNTREKLNGNVISHKGIGVSNVKRRVALLYPDKHELAFREDDHSYEVILKLSIA